MSDINLVSIFTIALLTSFGHCIGMCGGIVISYTRLLISYNLYVKYIGHFVYGLGRITTYCIIGGISAYIGSLLSFNQLMSKVIFILAGLFMILVGIGLLIPRLLSYIEINLYNIPILRSVFIKFLKSNKLWCVYFIGIFNGILPCGIVYFFALNASLQHNIIDGILIMFIFGIATLIPMVLFGMFSSLFDFVKYRKIIINISSILIILFGINTIVTGILGHNIHNKHLEMKHKD